MKKFFKNIRKKSPVRTGGHAAEGSPKLDKSAGSFLLGYEIREKDLGKLHKAAWLGDLAKVQQLAKKDPSPLDKENRTPLHLACAQGYENIVQELLEWKAKTNVGDADSRTPLMKAVEGQHGGCVQLLLDDKVELDSVDKEGNTCLHIAAAAGTASIVKMLCQEGASLTIKNREGLAPLHIAVREKQGEVCRTIISFRGQVDIEDNNLRTPLMYACQDGSINLVKLFLDHGASTIHRDAKGWTADDCAVIQGHHSCSQLISDQLLRQQRSSACSTPRSTAGSRSATPRGASPFTAPLSSAKDSASFGLPAADAGGDESGDETLSKASAKGAGSDSWGDDTDISLAEDKKPKGGPSKISLAKMMGHLPSDSDKSESHKDKGKGDAGGGVVSTQLSVQSQDSVEETSWMATDSPITPRKTAVRVSFKKDKELSEVHDIGGTDSEAESDHYNTIAEVQGDVHGEQSVLPASTTVIDSHNQQRLPQSQQELMEDLGVDDVSDFSLNDDDSRSGPSGEGAGVPPPTVPAASVATQQAQQGILKKLDKFDEASDWDTTEADDHPPSLPTAHEPVLEMTAEGESDAEEDDRGDRKPAAQDTIPKEVEAMMRIKQVEAQDSDEDSFSQQIDDKDKTTNLLSVTIEQSAKEYLGNDSLNDSPQSDLLDKGSQDSDWDSTLDVATPRNAMLALTPTVLSSQTQMAATNEDDDESEAEPLATMKEAVSAVAAPVVQPLPEDSPPLPAQAPKEEEPNVVEDVDMGWDSDEDSSQQESTSFPREEEKGQGERVGEKLPEEKGPQLGMSASGHGAPLTASVSKEMQQESKLHLEDGGKPDIKEGDLYQLGTHSEARKGFTVEEAEEAPMVQTVSTFDSCQNNSRIEIDSNITTNSGIKLREAMTEEYVAKESTAQREEPGLPVTGDVRRDTYVPPAGPLYPQQSQGLPQTSKNTYLSGPTAQQIKQRLQIGQSPSMYHSDGMESDDSFTSDNDRNEVHSSFPVHFGSTQSFQPDYNLAEDDVLSYTSTEFEGADPTPGPAESLTQDLLFNLKVSDPSTLVQIQDYVRESKRQLEQERSQRQLLDNKLRLLTKEKQDLHKKVENISEVKKSLEQNKLDIEALVRSLEYNLSEEKEKRSNAEFLLNKTKEQLLRKEQQFTGELEAKQRAELTMRNIQLEMRTAQNSIKELEEEREELERQLQHEHNSRKLQEQINEEHSRLIQQQHQETIASSTLPHTDNDNEQTDFEGSTDGNKVNTELYAIKMEMERQRSRFKDELTLMATENEELQSRVVELKNEIKLNEEALAHATMQYNLQLGNLHSEAVSSSAAFDREHAARDKLETELESLQKRLQAATLEKDKAVTVRNEMEYTSQLEKQNHARFQEHKEEEMAMLKENNQHLHQQLTSMETKLNAMENELHVSNTSLMERTNQIHQLRQEVDGHKASRNSFDNSLRFEKEMNIKLQVKIESLQERLSQAQQETAVVKQQMETLRTASLSATNAESHDHLSTIINSLRSDRDETKTMLEERNNSLMEEIERLKAETRNAESQCKTAETKMEHLQKENSDMTQRLSFSEAQVQLLQKTKEQLHEEKSQLKVELEKASERHRLAQQKCVEAEARLAEVTNRLESAEHTTQISTQNLAATSASFSAATRSRDEKENTIQQLNLENKRLADELHNERENTTRLRAELTDSQKVRDSLEEMCSNMKSSTVHLEQKLGDETANRMVLARKARESKALCEHVLASRSKLSQRAKTQTSAAERRKAASDVHLIEEQQKNQQLQVEVSHLKAHLKAAKKKIKVQADSDGVDLKVLQQELEIKYRQELNSKIQEINTYLETQAHVLDHLDSSRTENETRLAAEKRHLEEENTDIKLQYQQALAQKESLETEARRFKQLYESEMNWRMRLSDQLQVSSEKFLHSKPQFASRKGLNSSVMNKSDVSINLNNDSGDALSNKVRAQLDRSIAKQLEAAPHADIKALTLDTEDTLLRCSLAKSSKDYIDILKRKYCLQ